MAFNFSQDSSSSRFDRFHNAIGDFQIPSALDDLQALLDVVGDARRPRA
jgi:hypothetical protein